MENLNDITVIKFGTGTLRGIDVFTDRHTKERTESPGWQLSRDVFRSIAKQIAKLHNEGKRFVLVTSGARQAGMDSFADRQEAEKFTDTQLASIGQPLLLQLWGDAFAGKANSSGLGGCDHEKLLVGQMLVTYKNLVDKDEQKSIVGNILGLIQNGAIPIINENDPVSAEEMELYKAKFGDNDVLTSMIAPLIGAKHVLFLTDQPYVYEFEPPDQEKMGVDLKKLPQPRRYLEIDCENVPFHLRNVPVGKFSRGGITSKVSAAGNCAQSGARVLIAKFDFNKDDTLIKFDRNCLAGTRMSNRTVMD